MAFFILALFYVFISELGQQSAGAATMGSLAHNHDNLISLGDFYDTRIELHDVVSF